MWGNSSLKAPRRMPVADVGVDVIEELVERLLGVPERALEVRVVAPHIPLG